VTRSAVPPPVTQVLDAADAWLPARMAAVEDRLREAVAASGERLEADATATLEAGGKRLRPMLVLLCAGPAAGTTAIQAAAAVELVHMATLVHDDVLDDAPLRRGVPTVFATSGRDRALALGDLLFSRAFGELTAPAAPEGAKRRVEILARASVGLALGELTQRADAFDLDLDASRYVERCSLKTARLFECACTIGRPKGDADESLTAYGAGIGLAFQLLDDVLDVSGPTARTGKARGTDLLDGTVTLPLILALGRDPELRSLDLRALDAAGAEAVCDRIEATGALEEVRADARERIAEAKRVLADAPLEADQRRLLELVADGVVERYS
jgi:geranylgeranyl pyrophosphate synthase